jgi:hypothetical protein
MPRLLVDKLKRLADLRIGIAPSQPPSPAPRDLIQCRNSSTKSNLRGEAKLGPLAVLKAPNFVEGTGRVMNTIMPNDYSYYEMLNALVQDEPAEALDSEIFPLRISATGVP